MNYPEFDMLRRRLTDTRREPAASVTLAGGQRYCDPRGYRLHRVHGVSSDAMTAWAFGVSDRRPRTPGKPSSPGFWRDDECGWAYAADADDLAACHETIALAKALRSVSPIPEGVVERMTEVYGEFWLWVICGINRQGDHIQSTAWNPLSAVLA